MLDLNRTDLSDDDFLAITPLKKLRFLNLFCTNISDKSLHHVSGFPQLEQLYIGAISVPSMGLDALRTCASLRYLDLEGADVNDAMLTAIAKLTQLEGLNIAGRGEHRTDNGLQANPRPTRANKADPGRRPVL